MTVFVSKMAVKLTSSYISNNFHKGESYIVFIHISQLDSLIVTPDTCHAQLFLIII